VGPGPLSKIAGPGPSFQKSRVWVQKNEPGPKDPGTRHIPNRDQLPIPTRRDVPVLIFTVFRFRLFENQFLGFGFGFEISKPTVSVLLSSLINFHVSYCNNLRQSLMKNYYTVQMFYYPCAINVNCFLIGTMCNVAGSSTPYTLVC